MSHEHSQIFIPPSFSSLYCDPTRPWAKPTLSAQEMAQRFDLCDDLANLLSEHALQTKLELHITEHDVLSRTWSGLLQADSVVQPNEALWVMQRLVEILNWPLEDLQHCLTELQTSQASIETPPTPT